MTRTFSAAGPPAAWRNVLKAIDEIAPGSTDLAIVGASEHELILELQNHDYPPPYGRALARVTFGGVKFVQLPTRFSTSGSTSAQQAHSTIPGLGYDLPGDAEPDDVVIRFTADDHPAFVIAGRISVTVLRGSA